MPPVIPFPRRQPELGLVECSFAWDRLKRDRKTALRSWNICRYKAEGKEKPWCISLEELAVMREPMFWSCWYCHKPLLDDDSIGLDRIDNSDRRYILGNVVPCCYPHNKERGDKLGVDEYWQRLHRSKISKESLRYEILSSGIREAFRMACVDIEEDALQTIAWKQYLEAEFGKPPRDPSEYHRLISHSVSLLYQKWPARSPAAQLTGSAGSGAVFESLFA